MLFEEQGTGDEDERRREVSAYMRKLVKPLLRDESGGSRLQGVFTVRILVNGQTMTYRQSRSSFERA